MNKTDSLCYLTWSNTVVNITLYTHILSFPPFVWHNCTMERGTAVWPSELQPSSLHSIDAWSWGGQYTCLVKCTLSSLCLKHTFEGVLVWCCVFLLL